MIEDYLKMSMMCFRHLLNHQGIKRITLLGKLSTWPGTKYILPNNFKQNRGLMIKNRFSLTWALCHILLMKKIICLWELKKRRIVLKFGKSQIIKLIGKFLTLCMKKKMINSMLWISCKQKIRCQNLIVEYLFLPMILRRLI
jgi:hypothetical protein